MATESLETPSNFQKLFLEWTVANIELTAILDHSSRFDVLSPMDFERINQAIVKTRDTALKIVPHIGTGNNSEVGNIIRGQIFLTELSEETRLAPILQEAKEALKSIGNDARFIALLQKNNPKEFHQLQTLVAT